MALYLKPLDQQVIVITGASSGIGLMTAVAAAGHGARIVAVARSASDLATLVKQVGGPQRAVGVVADVGDRHLMTHITHAAIKRFGHIDTWVNNAGVGIYGRLEEVSDEDSRRLFETNFWGVVNGSLAALPYLKMQGGALINVGCEVSEAAAPLLGMYTASKHAVKGFTDVLRIELENEKAPVSVTLIQPTAVNTPYPQHARNYLDREPKLPGRQIDPSEVANAILHAAVHPQRYVKVGLMATVNTAISNMAPAVSDWLPGQQQLDMLPSNPEGALHHSGGGGRTHGWSPSIHR